MITGIGIDLIEISRFSNASNDFLRQIFSQHEIRSAKNKTVLLSLKFALKESILKALRFGMYYGFFWRHIQLRTNNKIVISGALKHNQLEKSFIHTSKGCSKKYACALAITGYRNAIIFETKKT